ncbi:Gfo/Idh/MocA family protein [Streptomyces shenzhenensis]
MIGVGVIGTGGIGRSHLRAWQLLGATPDGGDVHVVAVGGRPGPPAQSSPLPRYDNWHDLVDDPAVHVVDVCAPDTRHQEMAEYVLAAGKHLMCEKPLAFAPQDRVRLLADARRVATGVCFVYRHLPAAAYARMLIADGRLGTVTEVRAHYLQQWALDVAEPSWRMDGSGAGVLGDLGTHLADLAAHLIPDFRDARVTAASSPDFACRATWTTNTPSGIHGVFDVSRTARGYDNHLRLEVFGTQGTVSFTSLRPDEVTLSLAGDPALGGIVKVDEMTNRAFLEQWWGPGSALGWGDLFLHQASDMIDLVRGRDAVTSATLADGCDADALTEAVRRTAHAPVQKAAIP